MQPYEPPENFSSLILSTAQLVGIFDDITLPVASM